MNEIRKLDIRLLPVLKLPLNYQFNLCTVTLLHYSLAQLGKLCTVTLLHYSLPQLGKRCTVTLLHYSLPQLGKLCTVTLLQCSLPQLGPADMWEAEIAFHLINGFLLTSSMCMFQSTVSVKVQIFHFSSWKWELKVSSPGNNGKLGQYLLVLVVVAMTIIHGILLKLQLLLIQNIKNLPVTELKNSMHQRV